MPVRNLLRGVIPDTKASFGDGVAWGTRMLLAFVHLLFGLAALLRPNVPLLYPSYAAFDDVLDFHYWGYAGMLAAALLIFIPSRSAWAVLSVGYSMALFYLIGATFGHGAGLIPGTTVYTGLGIASALLLVRGVTTLLEGTRLYRWAISRGAKWMAQKKGSSNG